MLVIPAYILCLAVDGVTQSEEDAAAVKRAFEDYLGGVGITISHVSCPRRLDTISVLASSPSGSSAPRGRPRGPER